MKQLLKQMLLLLALMLSGQLFSQALGWDNHRIAISADGNNQADNHPEARWPRADPDDWGGTPTALAMIAAFDIKEHLVHYSYNNFIGAPPHTTERNVMDEAVQGAIQRWGYDASLFFDVPEDNTTAINHLAEELKKSTAADPLYFIHMGPAEFFYQAVEKTVNDGKIEALSHVYIISHSGYNDDHLRRDAHHTITETITLSGDKLNYKKIIDQNKCDDPNVRWCSEELDTWHWMRDHPTEDMQWLYTRYLIHPKKGPDVSDAGMVWYLIKDEEQGNPGLLRNLIGDGIVTTPCEDFNFNGIQDFEISTVPGFVPQYKDTGRNAIGVNAGAYKDQFGATQKIFEGPTGNYNITITSLTEEDGESTYRLKVDGVLVGSFQNPEVEKEGDMKPYTYTFENVSIKHGDVFQIESNTHTNGKIPEGDGTAWARGRWRSIEFNCLKVTANTLPKDDTKDCIPEEIDGLLVFEAERFELKGDWKLGTDEAASGGKYIYFSGPNSYQQHKPENNISYSFKINNPGTYTFKWTMRQEPGEQGSDLANDAWFYFDGDIGLWKLDGVDQVLTQFRKFVGRSDNTFTFNGAIDVNHKSSWVRAKFETAGTYTLNLSGRSHGFELDRIVLFKSKPIDEVEQEINIIAETTPCAEDNPAESLRFAGFPAELSNKQTIVPVTINYLAEGEKELIVSIKDKTGTTIKSITQTVANGTGEATLSLVLDTPLAIDTDYEVVAQLAPIGGGTASKEFTKSFDVVDGDVPADLDEISFVEAPVLVSEEATSITIKASYGATQARDVILGLFGPDGTFITNTKYPVTAGSREGTITLNLKDPLALDTAYRLAVSIRTVGGKFSDNFDIDNHNFDVVTAEELSTDKIEDNKLAVSILQNPVSSLLTFNADEPITSVNIYNFNGQLLKTEILNAENEIPFEAYPTGIYFAEFIFSGNTRTVKKIIKE